MADKDNGKKSEQNPSNNARFSAKPTESTPIKPTEGSSPPAVEIKQEEHPSVSGREGNQNPSISNQTLVDRIDRSDRWMIALTAVIAIGGIVSAFIFGWQLSVMKGQLRSMEADQRPWIFLPDTDIFSALHIEKEGANVMLQFHPKNVGKTPGKFASIEGVFFAIGADGHQSVDPWGPCDDVKKHPTSRLGGTIFPNEDRPLIRRFILPPSEMKRLRDGSAVKVAISGCIDYLFESSEGHHQTRFIYEMDRPTPEDQFAGIKFEPGDIPARELILYINPNIAIDAD